MKKKVWLKKNQTKPQKKTKNCLKKSKETAAADGAWIMVNPHENHGVSEKKIIRGDQSCDDGMKLN